MSAGQASLRRSARGDFSCGERGIRTLGRLLTCVRLASGYLRPLGHLSKRFRKAGGRERSRRRFGVKRDRWGPKFGRFYRGFTGGWGSRGDVWVGGARLGGMLLTRPDVPRPSAAACDKARS